MASGLTPTYLLPYPLQTDAVDVAADVKLLADAVEVNLLTKSSIASPVFTGIPVAPTAGSDTSTTQIATTQFVMNQGYLKSSIASSTYAPIVSPTFSGNPTAPTQALGNNTTRIATTAFIANALENFVTLPAQSNPTTNGQYLFSNGTSAAWGNIAITDITNLSSTISGLATIYSPLNLTINSKTSTYTLLLEDSANQIEMNVTSGNTLYVPTDSSVNFPKGTTIIVVQTGTGQTTIAPVTPGTTTINGTPGLKLRTQWSTATLVKRAANLWIAFGDLSA